MLLRKKVQEDSAKDELACTVYKGGNSQLGNGSFFFYRFGDLRQSCLEHCAAIDSNTNLLSWIEWCLNLRGCTSGISPHLKKFT
jgi:hypothetical protein